MARARRHRQAPNRRSMRSASRHRCRPDRGAPGDSSWSLVVNAKTVDGLYRASISTATASPVPDDGSDARRGGLLLSEDGATPKRSGFLTPAAALGTGQLKPQARRRPRPELAR